MSVAALVVNKCSPPDAGALLAGRHAQEAEHIEHVRRQLPHLPLLEVPLLPRDVQAPQSLTENARSLHRPARDEPVAG